MEPVPGDMDLSCGRPAMCSITTVLSLPTLDLFVSQGNLRITVASSLCLDLPTHLSGIETVDQLLDFVKESHLWIARTGSCCFDVSITVNGDSLPKDKEWGVFSLQVKQSKLWDRLCLRLERDCDAVTQLPGVMTFSIHHPDLASVLLPPAGAVISRFRSVILSIDIVEAQEEQSTSEPPLRPSKKRKTTRNRKKNHHPEASEQKEVSSLDVGDRLAVENFMSSLNFTPHGIPGQSAITTGTGHIRSMEETMRKLFNTQCVEAIFEQLMLAPRKKYEGIKVSGDLSASCLTTLVPGVFHIPYVKTISERSEYLKVISSSLARMRNAESPRLRQKISELGLESTERNPPTLEWGRIVASIEKKTWHILLARSSIPSLKGQTTKKRQSSAQCKSDGRVLSDDPSHSPLEEHVQNFLAHFNMEDDSLCQGRIGIDGSIAHSSPLGCSLAVATEQDLNSDYSAPVAWPTERNVSLPLMRACNEPLTQSQPASSDFGSTGWGNAAPYIVNSELLDLTENLRQRLDDEMGEDAGYHPSSFCSFDDWLSCASFGL